MLSQHGPSGSQGTAFGSIEWAGEASGVVVLVASGANAAADQQLAMERQALIGSGLAVLTLDLLGSELSESPVVTDRCDFKLFCVCIFCGFNCRFCQAGLSPRTKRSLEIVLTNLNERRTVVVFILSQGGSLLHTRLQLQSLRAPCA